MSWRQFVKSDSEVLRVKRVLSPEDIQLQTLKTLKTLKNPKVEIEKILIESIPQWQHDFCLAHAMFNNWRGSCPCSIDNCLISRILDSEGNLDKLRGIEIGQGVTTDQVIDAWLGSGEPVEDLFRKPVWLFCIAEHLANNESVESV